MNIATTAILAITALGFQDAPKASGSLDLDAFVKKADPTFQWSAVEIQEIGGLKAHQLKLTSQTWQGKPWTHDLQVYEPSEIKYPDVMLLFITGGANRENNPRFRNAAEGLALAKACGARVAVLPQVPNQPLMDGKTEDDLIAETFVRYLATKDETLPLLQPMVKSAVKAMDAVQEWAKKEGRPVPSKFVVTGASKRGWTTWLTGAVDPRVAAIAPMVIPTLNMKAQNKHQLDTWGKYSEQIDDYVRRGLMERLDEPDRNALWKLIDPLTYRDRLTMPKLQINGTNDPYWTLDSMNLYWDDLKGPKYVVYLPNAVHNLQEHRDWAVNGVGALFRHVASRREMPQPRGDFETKGLNGQASIGISYATKARYEVKVSNEDLKREFIDVAFTTDGAKPKKVIVWKAHSETKDFRKSEWATFVTLEPPKKDSGTGAILPLPQSGYDAAFADMVFEIDGLDYHLSSQIYIFGPKGQVK